MKLFYVFIIAASFVIASTVGFAAGGHRGGGSVPVGSEGVTGAPFTTPRGFGIENPQDVEDKEYHKNMFNEAAPGAWSKDPMPGKDKPSPDK